MSPFFTLVAGGVSHRAFSMTVLSVTASGTLCNFLRMVDRVLSAVSAQQLSSQHATVFPRDVTSLDTIIVAFSCNAGLGSAL